MKNIVQIVKNSAAIHLSILYQMLRFVDYETKNFVFSESFKRFKLKFVGESYNV